MRDLSNAILSHLTARPGLHADLLVWVAGINKSTGLTEEFGFWTGAAQRQFTIDGVARDYIGAGAIVQVPPLVSEIGLSVRTTRLQLSPIQPAVATAISNYEIRRQPVAMHVAYAVAAGAELIDAPVKVFDGLIASLNVSEPPEGGEISCGLSLMSSAVHLTNASPLRKSDTALQARHTGDRFRRYIDLSGSVEAVWGAKRSR